MRVWLSFVSLEVFVGYQIIVYNGAVFQRCLRGTITKRQDTCQRTNGIYHIDIEICVEVQ